MGPLFENHCCRSLRFQFRISPTSQQLEDKAGTLLVLEADVDNTTQRISLAKNSLVTLNDQARALISDAEELKSKATKLQEANVEGKCLSGQSTVMGKSSAPF